MKSMRRENTSVKRKIKNKIRNMILVSCYIGRIHNIPISNSFLEQLSGRHKSTYKHVKKELCHQGLIEIRGKHHGRYLCITQQGVRFLSKILIGEEKEDFELKDLYETLKKYAWIFLPLIPIVKKRENFDYLLQVILLLYSKASGENPKEYYKNIINSLLIDYAILGAYKLITKLVSILAKLFWSGLMSSTEEEGKKWRKNLYLIFGRFVSAISTKIKDVCDKGILASELGFRKSIVYLFSDFVDRFILFPSLLIIFLIFLLNTCSLFFWLLNIIGLFLSGLSLTKIFMNKILTKRFYRKIKTLKQKLKNQREKEKLRKTSRDRDSQ